MSVVLLLLLVQTANGAVEFLEIESSYAATPVDSNVKDQWDSAEDLLAIADDGDEGLGFTSEAHEEIVMTGRFMEPSGSTKRRCPVETFPVPLRTSAEAEGPASTVSWRPDPAVVVQTLLEQCNTGFTFRLQISLREKKRLTIDWEF
jgi:hypothetical protein